MVTILLEKILTLLTGWLEAFTDHAGNVLAKLNLIEEDTSDISDNTSDIVDNTNDIKDNTGALISPINSISSNTSTIKTDVTAIKNSTTAIQNNVNTISTNTGTTSAFCEDIANNTLDCSNRLVTIGSDTTQLRSNSNNITADVADIKTALNYYIGNTIVTEDSEGSICNFDTDLSDYLQACNVTIPVDANGVSSININKIGKNLLPNTNSTQTLNDLNFTVYSDGSVNVYGTASSDTDFIIKSTLVLPTGSYTLTGCPLGGSTSTYRLFATNFGSDLGAGFNFNGNGVTATTIRINIKSGTVCNNLLFKPMIRVAGNNSDYEPYKAMTYPITFGSTITDGAEVDLLSGVVKINSSPVTYTSITPIAIRTYKGINNIYSDIGNTSLTYRETLKHYLEKQQ